MNKNVLSLALVTTLSLVSISPVSAAMMKKDTMMKTTTSMVMSKSMPSTWTGTATWHMMDAESYNLYVREKGSKTWNSAIGGLNKNTFMAKVMYLQAGKKYEYTVASVKGSKEVSWSPVMMLKK